LSDSDEDDEAKKDASSLLGKYFPSSPRVEGGAPVSRTDAASEIRSFKETQKDASTTPPTSIKDDGIKKLDKLAFDKLDDGPKSDREDSARKNNDPKVDKKLKEQLEREQKEKEKAEKRAKEEADRKAKEEAKKKMKEEAKLKAKVKAEEKKKKMVAVSSTSTPTVPSSKKVEETVKAVEASKSDSAKLGGALSVKSETEQPKPKRTLDSYTRTKPGEAAAAAAPAAKDAKATSRFGPGFVVKSRDGAATLSTSSEKRQPGRNDSKELSTEKKELLAPVTPAQLEKMPEEEITKRFGAFMVFDAFGSPLTFVVLTVHDRKHWVSLKTYGAESTLLINRNLLFCPLVKRTVHWLLLSPMNWIPADSYLFLRATATSKISRN